jgi:uncharacterized protein YuzE
MLKFTFDAESSASYLYFSDNKIQQTVTLHDEDVMINLDIDADGNAVGLEVITIRASKP